MRAEIKRLHQRLRTTMIFVTHDQVEAMTMAEQIIILREGRVEQVGTPLDLYDQPANAFVAGFIGSPAMNLIAGILERVDGELRFIPEGGVPISVPANRLSAAGDVVSGERYLLGFRPEHLTLEATAPAGGNAGAGETIEAEVVLVEVTGLDTHVVAAARHGEITALVRGRLDVSAGNRLRIRPDFSCASLFDAATGTRLG